MTTNEPYAEGLASFLAARGKSGHAHSLVSFLNGALALGVLTALVPLIIHLFNRSRFKVIKWGASHLLESVLRKNRKQIQLEQWIILIIRCSIPILLTHSCKDGGYELEFISFLLLLPLAALLF